MPLAITVNKTNWVQSNRRVLIYYQTAGSMLPLVTLPLATRKQRAITHINIAAFHLQEQAGDIHLNDDPPDDSKYDQLWENMQSFQKFGVKFLAMLGGAAQGSFARLDSDDTFESYYG